MHILKLKKINSYLGCGVAMKNGTLLTKECANQITIFNNNEDGVIKHLKDLETRGLLIFNK